MTFKIDRNNNVWLVWHELKMYPNNIVFLTITSSIFELMKIYTTINNNGDYPTTYEQAW